MPIGGMVSLREKIYVMPATYRVCPVCCWSTSSATITKNSILVGSSKDNIMHRICVWGLKDLCNEFTFQFVDPIGFRGVRSLIEP